MEITEKFTNNLQQDSTIVFDNMSYLRLVECEYDDIRGVYRTYFDFKYN